MLDHLTLPLELLLGVVGLVALGLLMLAVRRRLLSRDGAFTCALRRRHARERTSRGWVLGLARYSGDEVEWFRTFGILLRPSFRLDRRALDILGRRAADGTEAHALPGGSVILTCQVPGMPVDLAMSKESATALMVWYEAAPPGFRMDAPS